MSDRGRLEGRVALSDTAGMHLFERIPPGLVLVLLVAGVGTFIWGLPFALPFAVGLAALALADWMDNYGLESDDH